jgi:hypothetical protein
MAKIRIDWGELEMAMESGDGMMSWYLDRETGIVIGLYDDDDDDDDDDDEEELRELREAIDRDEDDRYLRIPSLPSHEGFRIMEDFASAQADPRVRGALLDALDRPRPFRSFKDALAGFPEVREKWFAYHSERVREEALAWLRSEGVDAELVPFIDRSGEPPV